MDIREAIEDSFDHHESMADRELEAETPDTAADDAEEDYSAEVAGDDPVDEDGDAGDAPAEEEDRPAPNDAPKKKQK